MPQKVCQKLYRHRRPGRTEIYRFSGFRRKYRLRAHRNRQPVVVLQPFCRQHHSHDMRWRGQMGVLWLLESRVQQRLLQLLRSMQAA